MAVIEGGVSAALMGVGAETGSPAHITSRPTSHGALGHYAVAATSGTLAAALAAAAQLFTWRWVDATRFCVIYSVDARFQTLTAFTGGTLTDFGFDLFKVTAVSAGAGGTALTGFSKMRSTMAASLIGATDVRIASTAALTALTTLDTNAIEQSLGKPQRANPAAATEEPTAQNPNLIYAPDPSKGEYPLVLAQNEGFVIRNRTVWPVAGTGILQVRVRWAEVTAY
jgi:hypothetical protein